MNIRVGSLRGTSGEDGTTVCPLRAKKSRKLDLISLTPLMPAEFHFSGAQYRRDVLTVATAIRPYPGSELAVQTHPIYSVRTKVGAGQTRA